MSNSPKSLVAIVDDEESIRVSVEDLLLSAGITAESFRSAHEFLLSGKHHQTACLVTDIWLPGMSGLELQATLLAQGFRIPIVFVTAHDDSQLRARAMQAGALEFLSKPFDDRLLLRAVRIALGELAVNLPKLQRRF